jgi:transcription elongation factor SPT6
VAAFLSASLVGECIFRPSSKGHDHLVATLKTPFGALHHIDIAEENKPSPAELGAALWVGRGGSDGKAEGDKFDDLDEVIAR